MALHGVLRTGAFVLAVTLGLAGCGGKQGQHLPPPDRSLPVLQQPATPAPPSSPAESPWKRQEYPKTRFYGVNYLQGRFMALTDEEVLYSTDGASWQAAPLQYMSTIEYGNGLYIAGGTIRRWASSQDGVRWVDHGEAPGGFPDSGIESIAYGNGTWVAVGTKTLLTSTDGQTWEQGRLGQNEFAQVIFVDGRFRAVGWKGVASSVDGVAWETTEIGSQLGFWGVTYGKGTYVAVGSDGVIYSSRDFVTWQPAVSGTAQRLMDVTYGGGQFVAVGWGGTVLTSADGMKWQAVPAGHNEIYTSVAYGAGQFVVVGNLGGGVVLTYRP